MLSNSDYRAADSTEAQTTITSSGIGCLVQGQEVVSAEKVKVQQANIPLIGQKINEWGWSLNDIL